MKQGLIIVFLCSVGVMELTGALIEKQQRHGTVAPKLTMVAMVDGKAFFLDQSASRNRTEALNYCASLGMQLAEITSANQFLALDQAVVPKWTEGSSAWTGGIETSGIRRYAWNNSKVDLDPSYIRYQHDVDEDSHYFLWFGKNVNNSALFNALPDTLTYGVLCETLLSDRKNLY